MKIRKFVKSILVCSLALVMVAGASFSVFAAESPSTNLNKTTASMIKNLTSNNNVLAGTKLQSSYDHDVYIRSIRICPAVVDPSGNKSDYSIGLTYSVSNNDSYPAFTLSKLNESELRMIFRGDKRLVPNGWFISISYEVCCEKPISISLTVDGQKQPDFGVGAYTNNTYSYYTPDFKTFTGINGYLTFIYPTNSSAAGQIGTSAFNTGIYKEK